MNRTRSVMVDALIDVVEAREDLEAVKEAARHTARESARNTFAVAVRAATRAYRAFTHEVSKYTP